MNINYLVASLVFLFVLLSTFDGRACSCEQYENRSLCHLGDEANNGQIANFMAIVEIPNGITAVNPKVYPIDVIELLAGVMPSKNIILLQWDGASCSQQNVIAAGVRGVLIANLVDGEAKPSFCLLQESFFRMVEDTIFVPLFDERGRQFNKFYTLEEFRTTSCLNFTSSKETLPADEAFTLTYSIHNSLLELTSLNPANRTGNLSIDVYSSNGQHLLEARPAAPIDVSSLPPGMYVILIRNEQQAWSKTFVKPN